MKSFQSWLKQLSRPVRRPISPKARLQLESMEDRLVPSTFTVANLNDSGVGSFRQAIQSANNNQGFDTIQFKIQSAGAGVIHLKSSLPTLTDRVAIDATTQPGYSGAPIIDLDGAQAGASVSGLTFAANKSSLSGLVIGNFDGSGVVLQSNGNIVQNCFIGINAFANAAPNSQDGVLILGQNNTVGGLTAGVRNVISGNGLDGIFVQGRGDPFDPSPNRRVANNAIQGNYIGTDLNGTFAVANGFNGVEVTGSSDNVVGGLAVGAGNVISGNVQAGVSIHGKNTGGNLVQGNLIGTDKNGKAAVANTTGVFIGDQAIYNVVGSNATAGRNLVSGNTLNGVLISGFGTTNNNVVGNFIGTDQKGTSKLANKNNGVEITAAATGNVIGGTAAGARNVISGNVGDGVQIDGRETTGNAIQGNFIGTNKDGALALANGTGVELSGNSNHNTIGGNVAGAGNLISGNAGDGVDLGIGSNQNLVEGNLIGTDANGSTGLGNLKSGIFLGDFSANNQIGGLTAAARNTISGNQQAGIEIYGPHTQDNVVEGNYIGIDKSGAFAMGNVIAGVFLEGGAHNNLIGGETITARNIISGNDGSGVTLAGQGTTANVVDGNYIGTNRSGTASVPNQNGVVLSDANSNTIGGVHLTRQNIGVRSGLGNLISGNIQSGIMLVGTGAANNLVIGNFIGTNPKGNASLANLNGITIMAGANHNSIGDRASGTGNLISGNQNDGVDISNSDDVRPGDVGTSDNILLNNFIGTDRTGRKAVGNGLNGVEIEQGAINNSVGDITTPLSSELNIISGNALAGVSIHGDHTVRNSVGYSYIGTDVTGKKALPNYVGVIVADGANANFIDSATISHNTTDGVQIKGVGTDRNGVFGDYIEANGHDGVAVSDGPIHTVIGGGDGARSEDFIKMNGHDGVELTGDVSKTSIEFSEIENNGADGIAIYGGHDNRIGDYATDSIDRTNIRIGNQIFNNGHAGIRLDGSMNNVIQANDIGAYDSFSKVNEGNDEYGIVITNGSAHNLIGTTLDKQALQGNNISYNHKGGVLIGSDSANPQAPEAGVGNTVLRNLIFANGANNNVDGIHLGWAGAQTANDLGDADSGANNLQNKPVVTSATSSSFNTVVDGTLNSVANSTFRIEFFATDSKGQTMTFLSSIDFVTGPNAGTTFFEATFPIGNLQGQRIVATATNLTTGDTSEFSLPFLVTSVLFQ